MDKITVIIMIRSYDVPGTLLSNHLILTKKKKKKNLCANNVLEKEDPQNAIYLTRFSTMT